MTKEERCLRLGRDGNPVDLEGQKVAIPEGWAFLPAGDAGLTRKVTARTRFWRLQAQMGRRIISKGIWAAESIIHEARGEVETQRASATYQQKLAGERRRRAVKQEAYEEDFLAAVRCFLNFAPCYHDQEQAMAEAITRHAVPVGSGTVARTTRIPLEERAAHAVIAWMRHQTTAYDSMAIARIKGERRRVRRLLAQRSVELLASYRQGNPISSECPLGKALKNRLPTAGGTPGGDTV
ncbi:MAG: DUF2293 domain-containing protein [Desulfobulbus sp.]|nr:DUF2293 domain-containing protein [Desulfobulbus sp.]